MSALWLGLFFLVFGSAVALYAPRLLAWSWEVNRGRPFMPDPDNISPGVRRFNVGVFRVGGTFFALVGVGVIVATVT